MTNLSETELREIEKRCEALHQRWHLEPSTKALLKDTDALTATVRELQRQVQERDKALTCIAEGLPAERSSAMAKRAIAKAILALSTPTEDVSTPGELIDREYVRVPVEVVEFLRGAGPLDGVWFGEDHPTERGKFWWRKRLIQAAEKGE